MLKQIQPELHKIKNLPTFPIEIINRKFSNKDLKNPFIYPEKIFFEDLTQLRSFFKNFITKLLRSPKLVSNKYIKLLITHLNISTKIFYKYSIDTIDKNKQKTPFKEGFLCRKTTLLDGKTRYHIYEPILEIEFKFKSLHKIMEKAKSLANNKEGFIWKKLDILYKPKFPGFWALTLGKFHLSH